MVIRARMMSFVLATGLAAVVSWPTGAQEPMPAPAQAPLPATPAPPVRKLELSFDGKGNVTLVAQAVTVREILAEWTRKGGSQVVGAEGLSGGPITRQFENRPEIEVLSSLLRSALASGCCPAPVGSTGPSRLNVQIKADQQSDDGLHADVERDRGASEHAGIPGDEIPPVIAEWRRESCRRRSTRTRTPRRRTVRCPAIPIVRSCPVVPVVPVTTVPTAPDAARMPPTTTGRGGGGR